jgi:predicted nucleotidyltransferase
LNQVRGAVADIERRVVSAVEDHPAVQDIDLVGSRAEGRATELSDWDFRVRANDFESLARDLPVLLAPLEPIAQQWDRLSPHQCWMLMLHGPVKIDLIFRDEPHQLEPPWEPRAENLPELDAHFWDWILWLGSKEASGKRDLVRAELQKLFEHLLGPIGVTRAPSSTREAIRLYLDARARAEGELGVNVPRRLENEVLAAFT